MFNGIIGNDGIKQELEQTIKLNKLSHSYLFLGAEGIGKKQIAKEFAKMILCLDEVKYCNKCKSCIEFDSNSNPDFLYIEPDGASIKIDQIRQMQKKILEAPIISKKKVYIINNADLMTRRGTKLFIENIRRTSRVCYYNINWFKRKQFFKYYKIKMYDNKISKYTR